MRLTSYDIGCEPSSVSGETAIQNGYKTFLLFEAMSQGIDETGFLKDLGIAVLECRDCRMTKFGYPNDEGLPEHPFYALGMEDQESSVLEVIDSPWSREVAMQREASARRIWGPRGMEIEVNDSPMRHFIVVGKEATFECIASEMVVDTFFKTFEEAFEHVRRIRYPW